MPKNKYVCDCNMINEDRVKEIADNIPSDETLNHLADIYKIMADRTRCKLLYILRQGEMCVCDIANIMSMSKSSISHQLAKMRELSVVKCRRDGKAIYYSLDDEHISQLYSIGIEHISHTSR